MLRLASSPSGRGLIANGSRRFLHLNHRIIAAGPEASADSPPLVLMHGLFGSLSNFGTLARRLSAQRKVVLADLRNHGASPWSDDASFESMADDIIELLDNLNIPSAVLCGHSLGGKVAMTAALQQPDRLAALIVADIAPVEYTTANPGWQSTLAILEVMASLPAASLGSRAEADAALSADVSEAGVRAFLLQNLLPEENRWRLNHIGLLKAARSGEFSRFPALPPAPLSMAARFIAGRRSSYCVEPEHREAMEAYFPGAEAEICWLDAGHWVHAEKPDDFAILVDEFASSAAP